MQTPTETIDGFITTFDFKSDKVRKGWWRYAKKFTLPKNQRTHYEITIPASNDSRSVVIYTQNGNEETTPSSFKLAIKTDGMTAEDKTKYLDKAKGMLLDFKRWYYLRHFEKQLETLEKTIAQKGKNWSEWMLFIQTRNEILVKIKKI